MMEGNYYKEWSTALGRDMEFKVYGSGGVPVLAFPCQGGRFYDWENNGMPDAAAWLIQNGRAGKILLLYHRRAGPPHPGPERRRQTG